jgi:hypothetical protein
MSQAFDLTQTTQPQLVNATASVENSLSTTVVLAMCAVGIVLSLMSLALPDWVLQPSSIPNFPMP